MNIGSKGKDLILRLLDFNLCHKIFLENAGLPSVYSSVPTVFALCSISREARKRTDGCYEAQGNGVQACHLILLISIIDSPLHLIEIVFWFCRKRS